LAGGRLATAEVVWGGLGLSLVGFRGGSCGCGRGLAGVKVVWGGVGSLGGDACAARSGTARPTRTGAPPSLQSTAVARVDVELVTEVSDELVDAFARLVPQLSRSAPAPGREVLTEMVESPAISLFVARDTAGLIIGSLTLAMFRIPTGRRAIIEDVVVDDAARGAGAGAELTRAALDRAAAAGARMVDLTSRPSREAANHLYQRLGFVKRDTNVYRYSFS
jgi:ribosomal protein S18 acetylase RimI-like enzyme